MRLSRRRFLRATGVSLTLPWLDAFALTQARGATASKPRRRMVCINTPLGVHPANFFPQTAGKDYEATPYLEVLKGLRDDFTVMSGLSHPEVASGHDSIVSFLTGAHHQGFLRAGFRNTISVDQLAAEHFRNETRFASLPLASEGPGISWTRSGARVPAGGSPTGVFRALFLTGRPEEVQAQVQRLHDGQSILDMVREQSRKLQVGLGADDRDKLDEYFTSVRELEQRLEQGKEWSKKPKPKVDARPPQIVQNPADIVAKTRAWFDLIHLALQTDSTRLVTLQLLGSSAPPPIPGVTFGHHDLSHHGRDPQKLAQLKKLELEVMHAFRDLLKKLKETKEEGVSLLDRTMLFFSSNLGDAATHATKNLPILLAGGGFKHGQHLAFGAKNPPPLCNLFVTMLQRLGIEADKFGSSTGTLTGLEMVG